MAAIIELDPNIENELAQSCEWYEERSVGLGYRFLDCVDKCLSDLAKHPERYPIKMANYREARIAVFPYIVVYQYFKTENVVFVVNIFHGKRNPKAKYRR